MLPDSEWSWEDTLAAKQWLFTAADSLSEETANVESGTELLREYLPKIGSEDETVSSFCNLVTNACARKLRKVQKGY